MEHNNTPAAPLCPISGEPIDIPVKLACNHTFDSFGLYYYHIGELGKLREATFFNPDWKKLFNCPLCEQNDTFGYLNMVWEIAEYDAAQTSRNPLELFSKVYEYLEMAMLSGSEDPFNSNYVYHYFKELRVNYWEKNLDLNSK